MEAEPLNITFIITCCLIILSALFSGTRTAYLSLSEFQRQELQKRGTKRSLRTLKLLSNPKALFVSLKLVTILMDTAVICSGFLMANYTADLVAIPFGYALVIIVGLIVLALFFLNEFWANLIVLRNNILFAEWVSLPVLIYFNLVKPFANVIAKILTRFSTKLELMDKASYLSHQKILAMMNDGDEANNLKDREREMIHSIFEFSETEVHEIMVPRIDMICVEENIKLTELTKLIKEKGHSRIPLYSEGVDNILGIVHAKDILRVIGDTTEKFDLKSLARPAYFVPESKKLHNLLKEFQQEKTHMAIVVDEYGGTAGLITLEDVIEEIVGDIQDEYDQEPPLYRKLDENTFMVDAKIDLHELNEKLGLDLPTEGEFESLGGLILNITGYVPEEKEVVELNSYKFVVEKVERNRIMWVKIIKQMSKIENEIDT